MNDTYTLFENCLKEYFESIQRLHKILIQEREAIEENQLKNFDELLQRKTSQLNSLQTLQKALEDVCQGLTPEQMLKQLTSSSSSSLNILFENIKKTSQQCDEQSQVNGMLIIASKNLTERMLDMLTGRQKNRTYSKYAKSESVIESVQHTRI